MNILLGNFIFIISETILMIVLDILDDQGPELLLTPSKHLKPKFHTSLSWVHISE